MLKKKLKLPIGQFPTYAKTILKNEYFLIKSAPNNLDINRVGVTFKSKAFKTAVLRNKLKRIVFDYFRLQITNYKLPTGQDLLIILNPPIISLSKDQINVELQKVISKNVSTI